MRRTGQLRRRTTFIIGTTRQEYDTVVQAVTYIFSLLLCKSPEFLIDSRYEFTEPKQMNG